MDGDADDKFYVCPVGETRPAGVANDNSTSTMTGMKISLLRVQKQEFFRGKELHIRTLLPIQRSLITETEVLYNPNTGRYLPTAGQETAPPPQRFFRL